MSIGIQVYKKGSKSAKLLQSNLKSLLGNYPVYRNSTRASVKINWGSSKVFKNTKLYFNHPVLIKNAVNKIRTLKILKDFEVPVPNFTTQQDIAKVWLAENKKLVARTLISSSKGKGIEILRKPEDFIEAPLYTEYIPKRKEYRVIIYKDKPITFMRKLLKKELESEGHSEIRNGARYNFVELPETAVKTKEELSYISKNVIKVMRLDFCAIDFIKDLTTGDFMVLEVNTAFGLGEKNSEKLAECIVRDMEKIGLLKTWELNNV